MSLSPVSRQWFYPMVGDIMLFYHRVEPRTGCWRVSASVRACVSPYPPPINPKAAGAAGEALGALGSGVAAGDGAAADGSSFCLTCICLCGGFFLVLHHVFILQFICICQILIVGCVYICSLSMSALISTPAVA